MNADLPALLILPLALVFIPLFIYIIKEFFRP